MITPTIRRRARAIYDTEAALPSTDHDGLLDLRVRWAQEVEQPILNTLSGVTVLTAYIIAKDVGTGLRADFMVEDGMVTPLEAMGFVGSFARGAWVKQHVEAGDIDIADVDILALWRDSDPDDTDPWWADVWQDAVERNGGVMLTDSLAIPVPDDDGMLTVYRGQPEGAETGLSWSTDRRVAVRFAKTGGGRTERPDGIVLRGNADPRDVLAYLTRRSEAECIILPENVVWFSEPI